MMGMSYENNKNLALNEKVTINLITVNMSNSACTIHA